MGNKYTLFVGIILIYFCCFIGTNELIRGQGYSDLSLANSASSSASSASTSSGNANNNYNINNNNNNGGHLRPVISVHKMHNHIDSYQRSERLHKFDLFVDPVCEQVHRLSDGQLNKFYSQLNAFSQNVSNYTS